MRTWQSEFEDQQMPPEIVELVEDGLLTDVSWHNDACPSFEGQVDGEADHLRLYVEPENEDDRESCFPERFIAILCDAEGDQLEDVVATEDLEEMLGVLRPLLIQGVN